MYAMDTTGIDSKFGGRASLMPEMDAPIILDIQVETVPFTIESERLPGTYVYMKLKKGCRHPALPPGTDYLVSAKTLNSTCAQVLPYSSEAGMLDLIPLDDHFKIGRLEALYHHLFNSYSK